MARRGIAVDETVECTSVGSGVAAERLLAVAANDYRAVSVGAHRFQFARSYRPTWALVLGFVLLPVLIGLLFFLIRSRESWTAVIEEDHRRVRVLVSGRVLPAVLVEVRRQMALPPAPAPGPLQAGVASLPVATPSGPLAPAPPAPTSQAPASPAPSLAPAAAPAGFAAPPAAPPPPPPPASIAAPPGVDAATAARFAAPAPPVAPPPAPPRPAPVASIPPSTAEPLDDAVGRTTRLPAANRRRADGGDLVFVFDTGERQPAAPVILIGRDPAAGDADKDPVLVAIDDPDRTVSKTHLAVRRSDQGFWVLDRGSTNGSAVTSPDGESTPLANRRAVQVSAGWTVHFGARSFRVEEAV